MAQQFGVGQGIIREALIELEHEGFLQRTPFSGTQVAQLTLDDAKEIFQIRLELEPLAFSLATSNAKPEDIRDLRQSADKMRIAAQAQDLDAFFEIQLSFRRKIWELSGNRHLQQALERVVIPLYALYVIRRPHNRDAVLRAVQECVLCQDKILEALEKEDSKGIRRIEREFLTKVQRYFGTGPGAMD